MTRRRNLRYLSGFAVAAACAAMPARADAPTGQYTAVSGTVIDHRTGLTWEQTPLGGNYNWNDAQTHCATKGGGAWRVPTIKELLTLVDHSKVSPAIDNTANAFLAADPGGYWSRTPQAGSTPPSAWFVLFYTGVAGSAPVTDMKLVRCVQ